MLTYLTFIKIWRKPSRKNLDSLIILYMREKTFLYEKNGESTHRKILALEETDESIKGIDLDKLSESEQSELMNAVSAANEAIAAVMPKAFRHFKQANVTAVLEDA